MGGEHGVEVLMVGLVGSLCIASESEGKGREGIGRPWMEMGEKELV